VNGVFCGSMRNLAGDFLEAVMKEPFYSQAMDGPVSLAPGMDEERPQAMDGPVSLAPGDATVEERADHFVMVLNNFFMSKTGK